MAELIPEPNIQATNIPTGGAPQVSFAPWATPKNTFASLSKTIAGAAQTMVNFNDLEDREAESRDAWKEQLDQIHGLTKTGQLSEADYMKIQREANGKAQKEGMIRAHENWSTMTANSKDRAGIVANALEAELKTKWASITNPDDDFATSIEGAEAEFFSPNEEGGYDVLGTDFNGNPVTADTSTMNPMELVALSQAVSAKRTAVEAAREEVRHQRTLEGRQNAFSAGAHGELDHFANSLVRSPIGEMDAEQMLELMGQQRTQLVERLKAIANQAYDEEVPDINAVLMDAITDYVSDIAENAEYGDEVYNDTLIRDVISSIQSEFSLRNDENTGEPILFAPEGSSKNRKLDQLANSALSAYATRMKGIPDEQEKKTAKLMAEAQLDLIEKGGTEMTKEAKAQWLSDWNVKAKESGIIDYPDVVKELGTTLGRVTTEGAEPTNDKERDIMFKANTDTWEDKDALLEFYKTIGAQENAGDISPSVASNARTKAFEQFRRGQTEGTATGKVSTVFTTLGNNSTAAKIRGNINKQMTMWGLRDESGKISIKGLEMLESGTPMYLAENVFVDAIVKDTQDVLAEVNKNGYDPTAEIIMEFDRTGEDAKTRLEAVKNYISDRDYAAMQQFFSGNTGELDDKGEPIPIPTFSEVAKMEDDEAMRFRNYLNKRQGYLTQLAGALQMAEVSVNATRGAIEEYDKEMELRKNKDYVHQPLVKPTDAERATVASLSKGLVDSFLINVRRNEITYNKTN